ncbi:hypothetical protein [Nocardia asiatica]
MVDVITGTGMRPHEVFALLLEDIISTRPIPTSTSPAPWSK